MLAYNTSNQEINSPPPVGPRKGIRTRRQAALDEGNRARELILPECWANVAKHLALPHSDARFLKCEAPYQPACVDDLSSEDSVAGGCPGRC